MKRRWKGVIKIGLLALSFGAVFLFLRSINVQAGCLGNKVCCAAPYQLDASYECEYRYSCVVSSSCTGRVWLCKWKPSIDWWVCKWCYRHEVKGSLCFEDDDGGGGGTDCFRKDENLCDPPQFTRSPAHLSVQSVTSTTADLQWTPGFGDAQLLKVCKFPKNPKYSDNCEIVVTLSMSTDQYTATGLEPNTHYRYIVATLRNCGGGTWEKLFSRCAPDFTTSDANQPPTCDLSALPSSLTEDVGS